MVERHDSFGRETSSRNSEVIHAGFYYPAGSLKATLCVEGTRLLYEFCRTHAINFRQCGKLLIAKTASEETEIARLFKQGISNGVSGLSLLDRKGIAVLEPAIRGNFGLYSATTGILDTHSLMKKLESLAVGHGAVIAYNCEVTGVSKANGGYQIAIKDVDGSPVVLQSDRVINAAGLSADKIAAMAGIDPDQAGYRIHYCKGEYFAVSSRHRGVLSHLVYPVPAEISLGIHGVLALDGSLRLGPSAFFVDAVDYSVDERHRSDFFRAGRTLFPFIMEEDLLPAMAGIRPKLERDGAFRDFVIREECDRGLPGLSTSSALNRLVDICVGYRAICRKTILIKQHIVIARREGKSNPSLAFCSGQASLSLTF